MPYRVQRDHAFAWLLAALPLPCGLIIALFNERFTSRSWRFASGVPGGYAAWSGVLIVLGIAMVLSLVVAHFHQYDAGISAFIVSAVIVGVWWVLLGGLFIYTAVQDQLANPLGGVVWTWVGVLYWTFAFYEKRHFA